MALKNAIIEHFVSMAITQDTQNGLPACWSAGKWNADYWATTEMEEGITQLFIDLGLDDRLTAMKNVGVNAHPGAQPVYGFWLPVWKFRLDRDAKNGRLALSSHSMPQTLPNTCLVGCSAVTKTSPRCATCVLSSIIS